MSSAEQKYSDRRLAEFLQDKSPAQIRTLTVRKIWNPAFSSGFKYCLNLLKEIRREYESREDDGT